MRSRIPKGLAAAAIGTMLATVGNGCPQSVQRLKKR